MHGPPAVSCQVKRSAWHLRVIVGFSLLAIAGLIGSLSLGPSGEEGWQHIVSIAVIVSCIFVAYLGWQNTPNHRLQWDGQSWTWPPFQPDPIQSIHIAVDFQNLLVVRIAGQRRSQWLWLERMGSAENWRALRRALVFAASHGIGASQPAADGLKDGVP